MLKADLSQYAKDNHILKTAIVLVDTREQENAHIIEWLTRKSIAYEVRKLEYGDYGIMLPKNETYGIATPLVLEHAVERKGSLDELAGNLANERDRIEEELWRGNGKLDCLVEDGSLGMIKRHEYRSAYNEKSFLATILALRHRYNVPFWFVEKDNAAETIYGILYYKLREALK